MHRIIDFVNSHHRTIDRVLVFAGVILPAGAVAIAVILYRGDWPTQRFLIIYMAPLFAFGAGWARRRLRILPSLPPTVVALDAVAFVAGGLRAGGGWGLLPYSGHMLFLIFVVFGVHQGRFRWSALALAAMTTWFKLVVWHDWQTWTLGLLAGVALATVQHIVNRTTALAPDG